MPSSLSQLFASQVRPIVITMHPFTNPLQAVELMVDTQTNDVRAIWKPEGATIELRLKLRELS